ncbi:TetR/AcrR family transcriptional regulator [Lutimaribacter marinistellae]|uniref:TetR/AcrR family transcriptional regulator n=1 Tax=Lutimaribacter marinistellae TaxID=1820329 RepID=A0ABV7TN91_9RHOB
MRTARGLVEQGGWTNCTLNKAAAGTGVAVGSVYTHFGKITDLYVEVFNDIAKEEIAVIAAIAEGEGTEEHRFSSAVDTFARRALQGPIKAYAVIAEPVAAEVDEVRQKTHALFIDEFERIIAGGLQNGAFRPEKARISAACVLGLLVDALVFQWFPKRPCRPTAVCSFDRKS